MFFQQTEAKPGNAPKTSLSLIISLISSAILFLPQLYGAATPKRFEVALLVVKIAYIIVIKTFLNPEGHKNTISGSKNSVILLKEWIMRIGGVELGRVLSAPALESYHDSELNLKIHQFFIPRYLSQKYEWCSDIFKSYISALTGGPRVSLEYLGAPNMIDI